MRTLNNCLRIDGLTLSDVISNALEYRRCEGWERKVLMGLHYVAVSCAKPNMQTSNAHSGLWWTKNTTYMIVL